MTNIYNSDLQNEICLYEAINTYITYITKSLAHRIV